MKMKLLMEKFNRYLTEGFDEENFYGEGFNDFKQKVESGENVVGAAVDSFGAPIGQGSTRLVFDMGGDFILKTINVSAVGQPDPNVSDMTGFNLAHKTKANEFEKDMTIQQNFPDVFPRSYESADDNTWLVVEKVKPFAGNEELYRYLEFHEPFKKSDLLPARDLAYRFIKEEIEGTNHNYETGYLSESTLKLGSTRTAPLAAAKPKGAPVKPNIPTYALPTYIQMAKAMVDHPQMRKIIRAAVLMDVPSRELKGNNFGISFVSNKLVMLDMSLWD